MVKELVQAKTPRKLISDFVLTISDSEEDVPDFEEESTDEESKIEKQAKVQSKKKSKKQSKKSKNAIAENGEDDEEGSTAKDLNPDFIFSLGDGLTTNSNFDGWDFDVDGQKDSLNSTKDVDLDGIIRRKGGLTGKLANESGEEEEEVNRDDDDDDELALDGFGMGAPPENTDEDADENDEDGGSEASEEDEDEDEQEEEPQEVKLNLGKDAALKDEGIEEDTAEAMAEFYASDEEDEESKKIVHKNFQSLELSRPVLKGLSALGYTKPSPIQSASIPIALLGKDIVAGAVTGSGKTAAYMIPIIERLLYKPSKITSTRVIVLAPTRELAIQVADVGRKIGQYVNGLTFGLAVGGLNLKQQEQELKKRPDIVIATPGRFIDHIRNSPSFNVDSVEVLVLDEADRMLEEGFQKEITEILSLVPSKRQTMLFSATMNSNIKSLIQLSLRKPVRIMIGAPKAAATGLVQEFVRVRKREASKPALLYSILSKLDSKQQNRIIVFVARKEMAHRLRIILGLLGIKVSELHGSLTQEQRLKSITDFKKLTVPVLVCTDLAARGLDIPKIEVVVNFDMPKTHEIYLHRVGRTARAGREGISISFVGESTQDRGIVKEAIKQVEAEKSGKAVGKNVDWVEVEKINKVVQEKTEVVTEILDEEKQEKEILRAEMELKKGENLLNFRDEINSRPKRTWFQSEKEKKEDKVKSLLAKDKKPNSKKRKAEEAREEFGRSYKKTKADRTMDKSKAIASKNAKKANKKKIKNRK